MMDKILVADDDLNICELLRLYLEKEGFEVVMAHDGEEAVAKFESEKPSLILLDIMMPKLDGWQVCRQIRQKSDCPIIMLTAKGETFDKVLGLELGADDYVVKPFDTKEIVARIKAVLRRSSPAGTAEGEVKEVSYDKLTVNMTRYELKVDGKVVDAPPKELELLFHLPATPTAYSPAISCWMRSGASSTTATAAPSMSTSSACAKSWKASAISGVSRPFGASAISSRSRNKNENFAENPDGQVLFGVLRHHSAQYGIGRLHLYGAGQ